MICLKSHSRWAWAGVQTHICLITKDWVVPWPCMARSPASQARRFSVLVAASVRPRQQLRREVTFSKLEGVPAPGLECWLCTKQMGEGREGPPPLLPATQPGRPPAAWLSPSLGLELPLCFCLPDQGRAASCIINSTASLPVFTLITCWGGWVGGREQGGKPWSFEGPSPPVEPICGGWPSPKSLKLVSRTSPI